MAKSDKNDALETAGGALAVAPLSSVPSFIPKGDATGRENISTEDSRIPRLTLAQPGSSQVMEGDPTYIPGLTPGASFNDLTKEIYGKGPLDVIIVKADAPRFMEFDENLKVVDPNVPYGDPRTKFTTRPGSKERERPVATMFFDYVVLLGARMEPLAWSVKGSGIKHTARPLNGLISTKPVPLFACVYRLTPQFMSDDKYKWFVYTVDQVGYLSSLEQYDTVKKIYESFKTKKVEFDTAAPTDAAPTDVLDPDHPGAEAEI